MNEGNDLTGMAALVTGASRGIGRQIAITLAQHGADIAVNYLRNEKQASEVVTEIRGLGSQCIKIPADVSNSGDVSRMMDTVRNKLGAVHILINNAGIARPQPIEKISEEDWDDIIDINLKSAFLVTQAVLPEMRKKGWGRIVNISSVAAKSVVLSALIMRRQRQV
jgi:3-oxoacyl-[acyl-carrier protein] reductase